MDLPIVLRPAGALGDGDAGRPAPPLADAAPAEPGRPQPAPARPVRAGLHPLSVGPARPGLSCWCRSSSCSWAFRPSRARTCRRSWAASCLTSPSRSSPSGTPPGGRTTWRGLVLSFGSFPVLLASLLLVVLGQRTRFAVTPKPQPHPGRAAAAAPDAGRGALPGRAGHGRRLPGRQDPGAPERALAPRPCCSCSPASSGSASGTDREAHRAWRLRNNRKQTSRVSERESAGLI